MVFFAHGAQKLLGWFGGGGLKETIRTMHQFLGLPIPLAFLAIATEFCFLSVNVNHSHMNAAENVSST